MVSWGLGHNLEKNLQKAHALRQRGEDKRALELLLDWAEKHEDSPHYLYEAALTAFDVGDPASGLNSLKTLLRRFPDTREKILGACGDHFQKKPNLPLAEFLIDDHTAAHRLHEAIEVIDRVSPSEAATYAKRVAMRHQSLAATPNTPGAKVLQIQASRLVAAHALGDDAIYLDATRALLDVDATLAEKLFELTKSEGDAAEILVAQGCCQHRIGSIECACRTWIDAIRKKADVAEDVSSLLDHVEPNKNERGLWLAAQAETAFVREDADRACDLFSEACEADASLREEVLTRLASIAENSPLQNNANLAKLRLRLYVVLHRAEEAAQFSRDLREREVVELVDMRRLMHGGDDETEDVALQTAVAEAAIFDHDLAGAAEQANAIDDGETASLRRLLDAIDSSSKDWPSETRGALDSFGAVLAARAKDPDRCNAQLTRLWASEGGDATASLSVTRRCLENIPAQRSTFAAAARTLLDRHAADLMRELVDLLFATAAEVPSGQTSAPAIDGFQSVSFEDSAAPLEIDLGGLAAEDDENEDLSGALVDVVREDRDRSATLLEALDACAASVDAGKRFRHAIAYAALFAGEIDRALGELAVLQVTGGSEMAKMVREYLEAAVKEHGDSAALRAALADLQIEDGDLLAAGTQLAEALRNNPAQSDELSERFDRLLDRDLGPEAGSLWINYAEALFDTGRFAQLRSVCERGREHCDEVAAARLDLLATRVMVEEGKLTQALQSVQKLLMRSDGDGDRIVTILDVILQSHPGSAAAHFLRGEACHRSGRPEEALAAWTHAAQCDESLATRVEEKMQGLQAHAAVGGSELFRMAKYHVSRQKWAEAADLLEQAIRVDPEIATRVLGEFESQTEERDADLDLLVAIADAARVAGRPEKACELLTRVDARDESRIETVLTGFRHVRESAPKDLEAVAAMARVLLRHQMIEAAARTVAEASCDENYSAEERRALLGEFHRRCPAESDVALALAHLHTEHDRVAEAAAVLEDPHTLAHCDVERGVEIVREMRKREPGLANLALLEHDLLLRSGQVDDAFAALPLAEAVDDAQLHELTARFDAHREAALRNPSSAENYGRALWKQGRHSDAIESLQHAVFTLSPAPASTLRWTLADLLVQSDLAEKAVEILDLRHADADARRQAFDQLATTSLERLSAEILALQTQWKQHPGAAHVAMRLARRLLQRGDAAAAEEVLLSLEAEGQDHARRAILLAETRLELGRVDRAESVLRSILDTELETRHRERAEFLMAQCARLLGRPAEARARFQRLQAHCDARSAVTEAARRAYTDDLADVAGDFRAVLMGVGDLDAELHPLQEQS